MTAPAEFSMLDRPYESNAGVQPKNDLISNIAIADITKVAVDDFAKQITLIEISYFSGIKRSEFLSLKWNGRDKNIYAPNIVASTRWFNQLNFWVQKEILKYPAVNKRTEVLSYFVKLARRLVDLNNLYSAMSIVSALQVECIYRLKHTWSGLAHRERSSYRRLEELFGQQENCRLLREHTAAMPLPGIPYLGLYLSDLTYTNVAHPRINGQPTTVWVTKLNTIVDAIAHFQQSRFPFTCDSTIRAYLLAQRYIEELQKFLEDANFKASLRLEPPLLVPVAAEQISDPSTVLSSNLDFYDEAYDMNSCQPTSPLKIDVNAFEKSQIQQKPQLMEVGCSCIQGGNSPTFGNFGKLLNKTDRDYACECLSAQLKGLPPISVLSLAEKETGFEEACSPSCKHLAFDEFSKLSLVKDEPLGRNSDTQNCDFSCFEKDEALFISSNKCDQAVQVPCKKSLVEDHQTSISSGCLLCGHSLPSNSDPNFTPTPTGSAPNLVSATEENSEPIMSEKYIAVRPLLTSDCSLYSAILTAFKSTASVSPKSSRNATINFDPRDLCSKSVTWPPLSTALPCAYILCEGPIRRKTVGRLLPPGLDSREATKHLMQQSSCDHSSFSLDSSELSFVHDGGFSLTPTSQRFGSWKLYWAVLVAVDRWAAAYIVYFEALKKNSITREDFSFSYCEVQSFRFPGEAYSLPSVGLARHRNGSLDESSFLLTNPKLTKTYRLRPVLHPLTKAAKSNSGSFTPTSVRKSCRRGAAMLSLVREQVKKHQSSKSSIPSDNSSGDVRARDSSAPLSTDSPPPVCTESVCYYSKQTYPVVNDWLQVIQSTLDNLGKSVTTSNCS